MAAVAMPVGSRTWTARLLERVDAKDSAGFVSFLTPDARFRFANQPAAQGHATIAAAVAGFFAAIEGLRHEILGTWSVPDHSICEGRVTYTRHDGSQVTLPFVNVLELRGDLIADYRVYIDATPLFAAAA
jgi:ketosteroid isomerase-like protein